MSNQEGEKFGGGNGEADDEALKKELNDLYEKVAKNEEATFFEEEQAKDAFARQNKAEVVEENGLVSSSILFLNDILAHAGVDDAEPLRTFLEGITDKQEEDRLKHWIDEGFLSPNMSLAQTLEALNELREKNNEIIARSEALAEKEVIQNQLERERKQLERLCDVIDIAVHGIAVSSEVTRKKTFLRAKIVFHNNSEAAEFALSLPGIQVALKGSEISFLAQFNEPLLDEMQKRFSWIY